MNLGTKDRKKVVFLAILGLVAVYLVYSNLFSGPPGPPPDTERASTPRPAPAAPAASPVARTPVTQKAVARTAGGRTGKGDEFHPVMHPKRPEDAIDPLTVDPNIRLDLLAKVHEVQPAGSGRNLFQFGAPPPPKEALKGPEPVIKPKFIGPPVAPDIAKVDPPKPAAPPPPPPIALKYYGFSTTQNSGRKTAFFLDGDEILITREGETVKKRYRVVRIGVNSVLMEDTESKSQQSLPLTEEQAS